MTRITNKAWNASIDGFHTVHTHLRIQSHTSLIEAFRTSFPFICCIIFLFSNNLILRNSTLFQ